MREIKFRFWLENKEESFMCYPSYYQAGVNIYGKAWFDKLNTETHKYTEDQYKINPLQYTGLHDKNGTEIYEGDIVKDWEGIDTYTVVWNKQWACFEFDRITHANDTELDTMADASFSSEVIGNIYENKDLL